MENLVQHLELIHDGDIPFTVWNKIQSELSRKDGITLKLINKSQISLSFPSYLYGREYIIKLVKENGFMGKIKAKRTFFQKFLDHLTDDNHTSFGGRRLDCCNLNK